MDISSLSLEERIGQRFIMGVNNKNVNDIIKLIKKAHIGGVILYKKNYRSYEEMLDVIKKMKSANEDNKIPLFIAIDQEGGIVNRLPNEIHNLINIYEVSKTNINLVHDYGDLISGILKDTGINMNLGPVLDIYNGTSSRSLYNRCFYGETSSVTKCAMEYIDGVNNKVISVIKHYPGHGLTKKDTHFAIPFVTNTLELDKHIAPFNKLIDNGVDAIMIGHLVIRGLTGLLPASISNKFIMDNLRNNFDGLIMTDEINMLKKQPFYHFIYMNKALRSGSDILLIKIKDANEGYRIIDKYKQIVINNDKYRELLDESVNRIVKVKVKHKIKDDINYKGININEVNQKIDMINKKVER